MKPYSSRLFFLVLLSAILVVVTAFAQNPPELNLRLDRVAFPDPGRNWVTLSVTVADEGGRAVTGLKASDFALTEDRETVGGNLTVKPFAATDQALQYALLLDHREDLPTSLTLIHRGAETLIDRLGFRYTGAIISYTDQPRIVIGPTHDARMLAAAALSLEPVGGSPRLYDGIMMAADSLAGSNRSEKDVQRRAIVLMTGGLDQSSQFSLAAVRSRLLESKIGLFVLAYGAGWTSDLKRLSQLAVDTGGAYFFAAGPDDLSRYMQDIGDLLQNQYVIGYRSDRLQADGRVHWVAVEVSAGTLHGAGRWKVKAPLMKKTRFGLWLAGIGGVLIVLAMYRLIRRRRNRSG